MKIGVFGHYGNQNLGDEAITTATIQHIRKHFANAEIIGFSMKPDDTATRYGIKAYGIRYIKPVLASPGNTTSEMSPINNGSVDGQKDIDLKERLKKIPILKVMIKIIGRTFELCQKWRLELFFLAEARRHLTDIDLIIVAGSNQFLDNFGGTWGFPYTLLKWTILCKLTNTRIAFASIGAGPLEARLSKILIRFALIFSDYLSYRDVASKKLIENSILPINGKVYPDLAHSLLFETKTKTYAPSDNKPVVAINPMPIYDSRYWCERDDRRYEAYVDKMSLFVNLLLNEGYPVQFFSTHPKDENVIADILDGVDPKLISGIDKTRITQRNRGVEELMAYLCSVDVVIATRLHGTILSLLAEKPVFGITYHRKSSDVLTQMEQQDYFVSLDTFDTETLKLKFDKLIDNIDKETKKIRHHGKQYRLKLDQQYKEIFNLVTKH